MMISPETYYEFELKGKTREEILREIRSLKREIKRLERLVADPSLSPESRMYPSPDTRLKMTREHLARAVIAYEEATC